HTGGKAAYDWADDFLNGNVSVNDPLGNKVEPSELQKLIDAEQKLNPYDSEFTNRASAVSKFFAKLQADLDAEKSKPVYSLAPTQTIKQSLHPIYNVVDQFGNKYIFKPAPNDLNGEKYRASVEAAANKLSKLFGGSAP